MGKSNLLKDAIADAKAVRDTALANARMRMEEAFTPRLQSMISAKLQNEIEGEEDEEEMIDNPEDEFAGEEPVIEPQVATGPEDEFAGEPVDAVAPEIPAEPEMPIDTGIEGGGEEMAVEPEIGLEPGIEGGGEPVDIEVEPELDDEIEEEGYELDLESIIRELDAESDIEDEFAEEPMFENKDEDADDDDDDDDEKEELDEGDGMQNTAQDGTKNTDKGMKNSKDETSTLTGDQGPNAGGGDQTSPDRGQPFSPEKGGDSTPAATLKQKPSNAIYEEDEIDEEINLDEILKELEEADLSASVPEQLPDGSNPFKTMNEQLRGKVSKLSKDLKEHRQVVKFLKAKLNEVNLLNAKLLFTSKLFKVNNLNNSQKMKIIESFDRAKTLREVKLVYSTIAESVSTKKSPIVKKSVNSITESIKGGSSKPVASTKPNTKTYEQIVSETGFDRLRVQKLAGIRQTKEIIK